MNNEPSQKNNFEDRVLEKIKAGKIHMKTRAHFMLKSLLIFFVAFLVFCVSALCISYIFFSLQASNQVLLLGFGANGIKLFFLLFPWWIFWTDILLIMLLNALLRWFKIGYRNPFLYVLAGILALTVLGGIALDGVHVHDALMRKMEEKHFPLVGELYENLRKSLPAEGIFKGKVLAVNATSILVTHNDFDGDADDWTHSITVSPTQIIGINPGDQVFIYAYPVNGGFAAYGIRKIDNKT